MDEKHKIKHDEILTQIKGVFKKKLKFEFVSEININKPDGGDIDLICIDNETLFYVEVKSGITNITDQFKSFLGKRKSDIHFLRNKCNQTKNKKWDSNNTKYLFFIPNIRETTENILRDKYLKHEEDVYLFRNLNYFDNLASEVHYDYSKRELFCKLGIEPLKTDHIEVPAIKSPLSGGAFLYQFTCSAKQLSKFASVPRRKEGDKGLGAYQRLVSGKRLKDIAKYHIDKNKDFVNNIILKLEKEQLDWTDFDDNLKNTFKNYAESKQKNKTKEVSLGLLKIKMGYNSAFIIDGQHRLLSYLLSYQDDIIRVSGLVNINTEKEARYFLDINDKASSVSKDLIWDLTGEMSKESKEGLISRLVKDLNTTENKIFYKKLSVPSSPGKGYSFSGICRTFSDDVWGKDYVDNEMAVGGAKVKNPFFSKDYEINKFTNSLTEFFNFIFEDFDEKKIGLFFNDAVIAVYIQLYVYYLKTILCNPNKKVNILNCLKNYVNNIDENEIINRKKLSNSADKKYHLQQLITLKIQEEFPFFGDTTIKKEKSFTEKVEELEANLRKYVFDIITQREGNKTWFDKKFQNKIPVWQKKNKTKYNGSRLLFDFLLWNDSIELITSVKGYNYWKDIFEEKITNLGFFDDSDFQKRMRNIYSFRSPDNHGKRKNQEPIIFNKNLFNRAKEDVELMNKLIANN